MFYSCSDSLELAAEQKAEPPHPAADDGLPLIRSGVGCPLGAVPAGVRGKAGYGESSAAYLQAQPLPDRNLPSSAANIGAWVCDVRTPYPT